MIVVDTNIIAYLFLSSERSEQAEAALLQDPDWVAPPLWRSELRNILATYINKDLISLPDSLLIASEAESLMKDSEYEVVSTKVLELTSQSGCSAYDCEFVALALDLKIPLVTVDRKLLVKFPETAISMEEFIARK
jgi:predicted nucleic acid-binding protein